MAAIVHRNRAPKAARAALGGLLGLASACGVTSGREGEDGACDEVYGREPSLGAVQAEDDCRRDPAGAACDPTRWYTTRAAVCRARRHYPRRPFRGGIYYDVLVHRPVYRLFTALEDQDGEPAVPHRHLLLDARTGRLLSMHRADPERSRVTRALADGTSMPMGQFAGFWVVAEDRLVGLDLKVGKRFAEPYKLAGKLPDEGVPYEPEAQFEIPAHLLEQGTPRSVPVAVSLQGPEGVENLRLIAPLADGGRIEADLVAAEDSDDQHGGY